MDIGDTHNSGLYGASPDARFRPERSSLIELGEKPIAGPSGTTTGRPRTFLGERPSKRNTAGARNIAASHRL